MLDVFSGEFDAEIQFIYAITYCCFGLSLHMTEQHELNQLHAASEQREAAYYFRYFTVLLYKHLRGRLD